MAKILNDGAGILAGAEMTAGELFKILCRLNTFWKSLPQYHTTLAGQAETGGVVVGPAGNWDLKALCSRNGGISPYRQEIIAGEKEAGPLISWLCYAYSLRGVGIKDPVGWALARIKYQPGSWSEGAYAEVARLSPAEFARLLRRHIETGMPPGEAGWAAAFANTPVSRMRELANALGVGALWGV